MFGSISSASKHSHVQKMQRAFSPPPLVKDDGGGGDDDDEDDGDEDDAAIVVEGEERGERLVGTLWPEELRYDCSASGRMTRMEARYPFEDVSCSLPLKPSFSDTSVSLGSSFFSSCFISLSCILSSSSSSTFSFFLMSASSVLSTSSVCSFSLSSAVGVTVIIVVGVVVAAAAFGDGDRDSGATSIDNSRSSASSGRDTYLQRAKYRQTHSQMEG